VKLVGADADFRAEAVFPPPSLKRVEALTMTLAEIHLRDKTARRRPATAS